MPEELRHRPVLRARSKRRGAGIWRCSRCGEREPRMEMPCPGKRPTRHAASKEEMAVANQLTRASLRG